MLAGANPCRRRRLGVIASRAYNTLPQHRQHISVFPHQSQLPRSAGPVPAYIMRRPKDCPRQTYSAQPIKPKSENDVPYASLETPAGIGRAISRTRDEHSRWSVCGPIYKAFGHPAAHHSAQSAAGQQPKAEIDGITLDCPPNNIPYSRRTGPATPRNPATGIFPRRNARRRPRAYFDARRPRGMVLTASGQAVTQGLRWPADQLRIDTARPAMNIRGQSACNGVQRRLRQPLAASEGRKKPPRTISRPVAGVSSAG